MPLWRIPRYRRAVEEHLDTLYDFAFSMTGWSVAARYVTIKAVLDCHPLWKNIRYVRTTLLHSLLSRAVDIIRYEGLASDEFPMSFSGKTVSPTDYATLRRLHRLDTLRRAVYVLRVRLGLTYAEIADVVGIDRHAVPTIVTQAREQVSV